VYPTGRFLSLSQALVVLALTFAFQLTEAQRETLKTAQALTNAGRIITIPEGTLIELRFAQAVVGRGGSRARRDAQNDETVEAEVGDKVRLVVAADVKIAGIVVIEKGALAQATVTKVKSDLTSFSSGIGLNLESVDDVTGEKLPLRPAAVGAPRTVMLVVKRTTSGVVAQPEPEDGPHLLSGPFRSTGLASVPAGTRIYAYLNEDVSFDADKLQQAPKPNGPATITFFRVRERTSSAITISCNGRKLGRVGVLHYLTAELPPGWYSCQADGQRTLEIAAEANAEYFVRIVLQHGEASLVPVSVGEGEDGLADSEPVIERPKF
jgi:hypothetical protein